MPVELLAPARDRTCGEIAVNAGADAVYIGAPRFGARRNAANSVADVGLLVNHAHRYQARVYVTVNTVLLERELDEAVALLRQLYEVGVDAAIIQDLGLLEADLPPLPLIASTQTHAHGLEKVQFLEAAGFSRVILARELSIPEIAEIRARTTIELEAFVHGALCVCYSGQCYLSHAVGGRSANRGECAQPCRKRYRLVDAHGKTHANGHLLSPKDLNRIRRLGDLLDAGVTSFKIEGRLKDAAYVANTVAAYRRALDDCLAARRVPGCTDRISYAFTPNLDVTFHRGYVEGFAEGDAAMACLDAPKAIGTPVATVLGRKENTVEIHPAEPLSPGDGLCFFSPDGTLAGTCVQSVQNNTIVVNDAAGIVPGAVLHRNHSRQFHQAVKKGVQRKVPIRMRLEPVAAGLRLTVEDAVGNQGTATLSGPFDSPRNPLLARTKWKEQLEKTGTTEFVCEGVELPDAAAPFVPVAAMNDLRRRGLDALRAARRRSIPALTKGEMRPVACLPEVLDSTYNVTNSKAQRLHRRFGAKQITPGPEAGGPIAAGRVMISKYCLRRELGACLLWPSAKNLPTDLYLAAEDGKERLRLRFDCEACGMHVIREKT
ncbi:MAG TPA: U32 family peptidase [Thermoguttaceae bacterium]|nr:U32 family peptidase [Thermoguttaceae bacterium]